MEHAIFAMELCARLDPSSELRGRLHQVISGYDAKMSLQQKWSQYTDAASTLLGHMNAVEKGCWDYFDDDARALRDYAMWCDGMLTEEGARKAPSGVVGPYRGEARYLTFTMAFLLVQGSPTDRMLKEVCEVPEARLWSRDTFDMLLRNIGRMSFASVKSDVLYLIPRDDPWGLTAQDLEDPKFEYLRPLT